MKHTHLIALLVATGPVASLSACSGRDLDLGQDRSEATLGEEMESPEGSGGAEAGEEPVSMGGHEEDSDSEGSGGATHVMSGEGGAEMGPDPESGSGGSMEVTMGEEPMSLAGAASGGATMSSDHQMHAQGLAGGPPVIFEAASETPARSMDPYGSCQVPEGSTEHFPFECSTGTTTCTGWGGPCTPEGCDDYYVVCDHTCMSDGDCPVPLTGDAVPVCNESVHACNLVCDETTTCPDGYVCQSTEQWGLLDSNGAPVPPPFLCMEVFTATPGAGFAR